MRDFTEDIDRSLDLLFKVEDAQNKGKKPLLDKPKTVYLQVMLFRLPYVPRRVRSLVRLRHSLYGDVPEICLFVPNRQTFVNYKKTTDELIDFCVDYYGEFLEKHKVKGITTIMPVKQLKSEYGPYELRKKLVRRFDLFLCKKSLLRDADFLSSLGKSFVAANKIPFGVPFPRHDAAYDSEFQKNIEKAILTSGFYISPFSDNYSVPIGSISNTKKELKENLETVLKQLFEKNIVPGGFGNVRALYLWPSQSKSIPLYISTEIPVSVKRPYYLKNRRELSGVEGELSTQLNKKVVVMPNGEVFVTKLGKRSEVVKEIESEDDDSFKDESDDEMEEDTKERVKVNIKSEEGEKGEEETESEDDEEIEKREWRLLEEKRQAEEDEEEEEESEEETEKVETNKNLHKNQKSKRKRKNESVEEETTVAKKKKSVKGERKGKIKKAQKKTQVKQEKFNLKEKINKRKAKLKNA